jgi:hypothetical protein
MGAFLIAWLVGLSLHIAQGAREWKISTGKPNHFPLTFASPLPPKPGQILTASGIYIGLAILAESKSLHGIALLAAWGYNTAIALTWAQNYSTEQANKVQANGSVFWNPPVTASTNLFPTGAGAGPTAASASAPTTPGAPSGGPVTA